MCQITSPGTLHESVSPEVQATLSNRRDGGVKKKSRNRHREHISTRCLGGRLEGKKGLQQLLQDRKPFGSNVITDRRRCRRRPKCSSQDFSSSDASSTSDSSSERLRCNIPQYVKLRPRLAVDLEVDKSRYVAMDCEMVGIGENGFLSALARVSIANWDGDILLDTYVKVSEPVTDLRSNISGILKNHIDGSLPNTLEFDAAVQSVQKIISGKILIGHGLKNDLRALNISHPWQDTRDTTKYEPFMKKDANNLLIPRKLKDLSLEKLRVKIQEEGKPHCSVSDAVAAMQLYQKASKQWEKVIEYKVKKTQEILSMKVKDTEE